MRSPGRSFWLRPPAFSITQVETANGVFSSILLTEGDFQDPSQELDDTQKGAPVLERLITDVGFDQIVTGNYFNPASFGQVTLLVEAMIFTQDDQFISTVSDTASFDVVLRNNRILGYSIMQFELGQTSSTLRTQVKCRAHMEPKVKVKLREKALGVAIRTNFNVGDASVDATFPWVQPTMLVRVP